MTVTIDKDGTLKLPKEALEMLGTNQVEVKLEGKVVTLEPKKKRISELETVEERRAATNAFLERIQHSGNANLPEWHKLQDEIYD
jgi:virulence-associated protein VagC